MKHKNNGSTSLFAHPLAVRGKAHLLSVYGGVIRVAVSVIIKAFFPPWSAPTAVCNNTIIHNLVIYLGWNEEYTPTKGSFHMVS